MGEELRVIRNRGYLGGVNAKLFPWDIADTQAVELANIDTSTPGITRVRPGTSLTATGITMGPVIALGTFYPADAVGGGDTQILAISPTHTDDTARHHRLWSWDGSLGSWSHVGSLTGLTSVTGVNIEILQVFDNVSVANRHEVIISSNEKIKERYAYQGTTIARLEFGLPGTTTYDHPSSDALEFAHFRFFGAGSNLARNAVFVSPIGDVNNGDYSKAVSAWHFGGHGSGKIIAIREFRQNEVIVFLEDKIEELIVIDAGIAPANMTNWVRRTIDPLIGCGSRKSVATTGEDIFFVDQYANVRSIARTINDAAQGVKSLPISDPIQGFIDRVNKPFLFNSVGWAWDRFYYIAFPLDDAYDASHVMRFDTTRGAWDGPWTFPRGIKDVTIGTLTDATASSSDKSPTIFIATNHGGMGEVIRFKDGDETDSGTSIAYQSTSKRISYDVPDVKKSWRRLEIFAVGTDDIDLTISVNLDQTGWIELGEMNLLGEAPILPQILDFPLSSSSVISKKFSLEGLNPSIDIQVRMAGSVGGAVQILGFSLAAHPDNYDWGVVTN